MGKILLKGGTVLSVDPEVGDLADRRRADRGRQDRRRRGEHRRRRRGRRLHGQDRHPGLRRHPPAHLGGGDPQLRARTPPSTTTSSRCSTPSRRCTGPRTSTPATWPDPWSASTPASPRWSTGRTSTTRPTTPTRPIQGLQETGIRAQYAYGSANTSLEKYWYFSAGGHSRRRRAARPRRRTSPSDDGLLTMATGDPRPRLHPGPGGAVRVGPGPRARHPDHGARRHGTPGRPLRDGRAARPAGPARAGHDLHPLLLLQRARVAAGRGHRRHHLDRRRRWRLQMGHGWPPVNKARQFGLRPSLSIDVVTTVPGDMFTQIRAAFGAERARVNAVCWELDTPIPGDHADRQGHARRWPRSTAPTSPDVEDRTGSLTPGKQADVVVIDATAINVAPVHDPVAAVTLSADVSNVEHVIVAGEFRKRDFRLVADVKRGRVTGPGLARPPRGGGCQGGQGEGAGCVSTHHLVRRGRPRSGRPGGPPCRCPRLRRVVGGGRQRPRPCTPVSAWAGSTPGGRVPAHVHSYEESLYVLDGRGGGADSRARRCGSGRATTG